MSETDRDSTPHPFRFRVPDAEIDDLRRRLAATRWPDDINDHAWSWGIPLPAIRDICATWQDHFDWRQAEERLFTLPNYRITLDGLDTHFIHAVSSHADATPIILTHGWPGAVFEFLAVIPRLTHPELHGGRAEDAFHVVVPSLPGFGFSQPATVPGMDQRAAAQRHIGLMQALGYGRYIAQGGDWGSRVSLYTAILDPAHCIGLHLNMVPPIKPDLPDAMALVQPHEAGYLRRTQHYRDHQMGYFQQQSTRPQTLAYGLTDSPAGWCAWVAEKFHAWTDCRGDIANAVSRNDMLSIISLYWFTNTIASASRFYKEYALAEAEGRKIDYPIEMPTGIAQYPHDLTGCPRAWAERAFRLVHWFEAPRGGHFAALEQPSLFAADLWAFKKALSGAGS